MKSENDSSDDINDGEIEVTLSLIKQQKLANCIEKLFLERQL